MTDTIAALATGHAPSAIGVIRISGPATLQAVAAVFKRSDGKPIDQWENRKLYYGSVSDKEGQTVDMGLCTVSRGPHSYTGEDTAEIQCHGSPVVLSDILEALFQNGARQAKAGEFTKRAFLNGKMDLMQAEAVVDLIDAETSAMAKSAAGKLQSSLAAVTEEVYDKLVDMAAHFYAVLDYPDEDIEDFQTENYTQMLQSGRATLARLLHSFQRGKVLKEGVPVAIIGRPNAGKSSLLNALAGYDRAIVTNIPGTTRDTVEEKIRLGGYVLRLIDTAGIRETSDEVEKIGVERSLQAAKQAEIVLAVVDGSRETEEEDRTLLQENGKSAKTLVILNKSDLVSKQQEELYRKNAFGVCHLSARTGEGLEELEKLLLQLLPRTDDKEGYREIITNQRQAECLQRALAGMDSALEALTLGMTPDVIISELEGAMGALDEMSGKSVRDEVVSRIFARFCVGK